MNGAASNPDCHVFAFAGAQLKKGLEIAKKLQAENFGETNFYFTGLNKIWLLFYPERKDPSEAPELFLNPITVHNEPQCNKRITCVSHVLSSHGVMMLWFVVIIDICVNRAFSCPRSVLGRPWRLRLCSQHRRQGWTPAHGQLFQNGRGYEGASDSFELPMHFLSRKMN